MSVYLSVALALSVSALGVAIHYEIWYARQELVAAVMDNTTAVWVWWSMQCLGEAMVTASLLWWVLWRPVVQRHHPTQSSKLGLARLLALRAVETNFISIILQLAIILVFAMEKTTGFWVGLAPPCPCAGFL